MDEAGRVDVLVNNAGGQFVAPAEDISLKGFRAVQRLTIDAAWSMTHVGGQSSVYPAAQRQRRLHWVQPAPRHSYVRARIERARSLGKPCFLGSLSNGRSTASAPTASAWARSPAKVLNNTATKQTEWARTIPMDASDPR